jgi:hypothetical protein
MITDTVEGVGGYWQCYSWCIFSTTLLPEVKDAQLILCTGSREVPAQDFGCCWRVLYHGPA